MATATLQVCRRVWAGRLGAEPGSLDQDGLVRVDRADLAAVVVLRLGGTVAVAAPPSAHALLGTLIPAQLLDPAALVRGLGPLGPSLVGAATLSVTRSGPVPRHARGGARRDDGTGAASVLSRLPTAEREESGLSTMADRWVVTGSGGSPDAAAGYEVWDGQVAHLGVAVAPSARGEGLGAVAAGTAVAHALDRGLVGQWRCRADNLASTRLGARLGLVRVGAQVAVDLRAS